MGLAVEHVLHGREAEAPRFAEGLAGAVGELGRVAAGIALNTAPIAAPERSRRLPAARRRTIVPPSGSSDWAVTAPAFSAAVLATAMWPS